MQRLVKGAAQMENTVKFEKLKPGLVVYSLTRHKMGNTTVSTLGVHRVHIVSVDTEREVVFASWNSNPAKNFYRATWSKWREKEPMLIRGVTGRARLATREEQKAARAAAGAA
jgi:hypothetical protein